MRIGTKSLLFGAHTFWLHPWFVALGWLKLYGLGKATCPCSRVTTSLLDWRLWVCFVVHDLGYWGSPNMDGPEGENHPLKSAEWVHNWFDAPHRYNWRDFVLYHSRFLAKLDHRTPSLLCHADKAAIWLTPTWLYVPLAFLSGEIKEYRSRETRPETSKGWDQDKTVRLSNWQWYEKVRDWTKAYCLEHKSGKVDNWTPDREKR